MKNVTIVMYHYVRDLTNSRYKEIKGLDLNLFRKQIKFFKENYNIISASDIIDSIENNKELPEKSMLLTFDDGYIDHYINVFPILLENDIKGFFSMPAKILDKCKVLDVNKIHFILASADIKKLVKHVFERLDYYRTQGYNIEPNNVIYNKLAIKSRFDCEEVVFVKELLQYYLQEELRNMIVDDLFTEYVGISEEAFCKELYMSYDQIKTMKKCGMDFGIHGYDHSWLGKLSFNDMKKDVEKALEFYDEIIDRDKWIMCAPYGSYNDEMIDYISKIGCKLGFGTDVKIADLSNDNKYMLPRLDTNDFPPKSENYLNY